MIEKKDNNSNNITIAAIDIGTNSAHLVIANIDSKSNIDIKDTYKEVLKLGTLINPVTNELSDEGISRTIAALSHMLEIAKKYNPVFRAVCTHAIRSTRNFNTVLDKLINETQIHIEAIDGIEEARLSSLGMQFGLNLRNKRFLGVDIGGGSTELALIDKGTVKYTTSIQLGSVVLTHKFLNKKNITKSDIKQLETLIQNHLGPRFEEFSKLKYDYAVCCSGAAKALASIDSTLFNKQTLSDANGYKLTHSNLEKITDNIQRIKIPNLISKTWKIEKDRSDIILAGSAIILQISKLLNAKEWLVSTSGLREGLLLDTLTRIKSTHSGLNSIIETDTRWQSVLHLGEKLRIDQKHAKRTLKFSLQLYRDLKSCLEREKKTKNIFLPKLEILKAAAWLHECGQFVSFPRYHHHSAYLIFNGRISGYTQKERQMIGLVARFHRKGEASSKHPDCKSLTKSELKIVNFLASIIRIAVAANRTKRELIERIEIDTSQETVSIKLKKTTKNSAIVELNKIIKEKEFLEKTIKRKISVSSI